MQAKDLDRETYEDIGRIYTDWDELWLPSVSTILGQIPTPEKIIKWKARNNDWEAQRDYKANRGTMIHYNCLNPFNDGELWSPDEASSEKFLKEDKERWERYQSDNEYVQGVWDIVKQARGINEDNVIDVEVYVKNVEVGYAGQFDLLYKDRQGRTVLGDIKTGKGIYEKYPLQLTAYRQALDMPIDRIEVLRMNPDYETWEIAASDTWSPTHDELWQRFKDLRSQMSQESIDELKERAQN